MVWVHRLSPYKWSIDMVQKWGSPGFIYISDSFQYVLLLKTLVKMLKAASQSCVDRRSICPVADP